MFLGPSILVERECPGFFREYFLKKGLLFAGRIQGSETVIEEWNKKNAWLEDTLSGMENKLWIPVSISVLIFTTESRRKMQSNTKKFSVLLLCTLCLHGFTVILPGFNAIVLPRLA